MLEGNILNKVQNNELASLGVILKLKNNRVIVMTEKLDFVELNLKPGMIRGQKVSFTPSDLYNSNFKSSRYSNIIKPVSVVASVAAVFAFLFIGYAALFSTNEFAYVDIDINPSVEMAIDKNENVLKAKALNSDGQVLLDTVKLKNIELSDAVTLLLDKSKEIGFIHTNNKVLLSTSINSKTVSDSDIKKIDTMVSSLKEIADKSGVDSKIIKLSPEDRKEALETGLSMGKYYIYNKAKYEGISLDVEDVKNASVESLLSKVAVMDTDNIHPENQAANGSTAPIITPTSAVASTETDNNNPSRTASTAYTPDLFSAYATPAAMFGPTPTHMPDFTPSATDLTNKTASVTSSHIMTPSISTSSSIHTTIPTYTHSPSSKPIIPATPSLKPTDKVSVKLSMFNEIKSSQTKEVQPRFKLTNNSDTPIDLSKIKIRYYYTIDIDGKYQECYCDWSNIGTNHITKKIVKMSSNDENADHYLEVGFTNTDSLEPQDSVELVCRFGPDYEVGDVNEVYNQLNDYSFNGTTNNFASWDKATVYFSGSLIWGSEP